MNDLDDSIRSIVRQAAARRGFILLFLEALIVARDGMLAIFPKPRPSSRVGLPDGLVTFVAEKHADLRDAEPEKIVYPAMLADILAAFTLSQRERGGRILGELHRH